MESVECAVIGAGVVGLAIARALAMAGREVVVLESGARVGAGNSSRNSEVIHAGIYYPHDSLMAKWCVVGRRALYEFCDVHSVAYEACGKLIVAADAAEIPVLDELRTRAARNGVDLAPVSAHEARAENPELVCAGALLSRHTGILDSHGFMLALRGDLESCGGAIAFHAPVVSGRVENGAALEVGGAAPMVLKARWVINCAGLAASAVALSISGQDTSAIPRTYRAKGNYFTLSGQKAPFAQLIYPLPASGGLGVHLTLDLAHQVRFGPDVEWVEREDYAVDPARAGAFYTAVRRYWPNLRDGALQPAYCGIRPKLAPPGAPQQDFRIIVARAGEGGLVNLFGIESPGLTASLAIADHVAAAISNSARRPAARPDGG